MKRAIGIVIAIIGLFVMVSACSSMVGSPSRSASSASSSAVEGAEQVAESQEVTYQSIYDEYAAKIRDAVPGLIDEYNAEAPNLSSMTEKAALSDAKIGRLANINVEGAEKFAEVMWKNGDEYSVYSDWVARLNEVYMVEAAKITNAYMEDATGTAL